MDVADQNSFAPFLTFWRNWHYIWLFAIFLIGVPYVLQNNYWQIWGDHDELHSGIIKKCQKYIKTFILTLFYPKLMFYPF